MSIWIRRLRLIGITKNYEISFLRDSSPRPLSVVAGEISTGKSSVLEFVDYCLGSSSHPKHQEIQRQVRSALLEVDLSGQRAVIERQVFASDSVVFVHACSMEQLDEPHAKVRRPLAPPGDANSLSSLLLEQCGLAGISLKEAPARPDSKTDPLSFRDVMWLSFLPNNRLDNKQLLHEANFMQELKLRQVIEVVFGVHDDQLAKLGETLAVSSERRRQLQTEIRSLATFLEEEGVEGIEALGLRLEEATKQLVVLEASIEEIGQRMQSHTAFASNLRDEYSRSRTATARAATTVRDRETLLRRLLPLRGQYAEDEKKLVLYHEARRLFDPLRITVCPSCLQDLPVAPEIRDGACGLCGQQLKPEAESVDVKAELAAVRARKREVDRYVEEVENQLSEARRVAESAAASEAEAQRRLDQQVATTLAPFVAERDDLVRRRERLSAQRVETQRQIQLHEGLARRRLDLSQIEERMVALRVRIRKLEAERPSREALVKDLSDGFASILEEFGFPKLYDPQPPFIDKNFVPYVRGVPYRDIGSTGGLTLISLAWFLAIFERAVSVGASHPGFVMIDSPQKNLTPRGVEERDEFRSSAISSRVWHHLRVVANSLGERGQLIVVDNAPPEEVADAVIVRFSGRVDQPPYGLIDNEIPPAGPVKQ